MGSACFSLLSPSRREAARGELRSTAGQAKACATSISVILALALAAAGAPLDKKDVEYSRPGGKPVLLDLHIPDGPGPFPAAILVHGGGFDEGSKSTNVRPLFDVLANAGFAWFSIDYRLAPEFRFPQANDDLNSAIRWVKANAAAPEMQHWKAEMIACWLTKTLKL